MPIAPGSPDRNRGGRRGLSRERKYVLCVGISDLVLCTLIALDCCYWNGPLVIEKPNTFGEEVMNFAAEAAFMALVYKVVWDIGIITTALRCEHESWKWRVLLSAFFTRMVIGLVLVSTYGATVIWMEEIEISKMQWYMGYQFMYLIVPILMNVLYIM